MDSLSVGMMYLLAFPKAETFSEIFSFELN